MKWLAITGGLGSGKSEVLRILNQMGFPTVSADDLARQAVSPGSQGLTSVTSAFGQNVLNVDGTLDRKKLGEIIFNDSKKRKILEGILHPLIQQMALAAREGYKKQGHKIAFYEIPLLFEKNLNANFDAVVVVATSEDNQILRAETRDKLTKSQIADRLKSQIPLSEKVKSADYVIPNDSDKSALEVEVKKCIEWINRKN